MEFTKQNQEIAENIIALLEQLNVRKISLPKFRKEFEKLKEQENDQNEKVTDLFAVLLYQPANDSKFISSYKALKKHITKDIPFIDNKATFFLEYESKPDFNDKKQNEKYLSKWAKKRINFFTVFDFSTINRAYPWNFLKTNFAIPYSSDATEIMNVLRKITDFANNGLIFVDLFFVMLYRFFKYFYNHSISITYIDAFLMWDFKDALYSIDPQGFNNKKYLEVSEPIQHSKEIAERIRSLLHEICSYFDRTICTMECRIDQKEMTGIRRLSLENYDKFVNSIHNIWLVAPEPQYPFKDVTFPKENDNLLDRFEMVEVK